MSDETGVVVDATEERDDAVAQAADALREGRLVVVPTDTVYGVTADAFNAIATEAVFAVKRRQRRFPLPVLIRSPKQLMGLVTEVPEVAERLMAAYWPGPLTLVVNTDPNLAWDLGDNEGTVAVRMPMDDITLDLIRAVGPLATTSANLSGNAAATTVALAKSQLGDGVAVYVDGGRRVETKPSTIVDLTRDEPVILRTGPLPDDEVLAVARGELEPHQASAPAPRHKPVSAGGPADVMPDAEVSADADEPGATDGEEATPLATGAAASAVAVDHRAAASTASTRRRRARRPAVHSDDATSASAAARDDASTAEVSDEPLPDHRRADHEPGTDAEEEMAGDDAADDPAAIDDRPARPPSTHHVARDHRAGR